MLEISLDISVAIVLSFPQNPKRINQVGYLV